VAESRAPIPPIGLADHARSCETVIIYRAQHPDLPPRDPEDQRADDRWAFLHPITSIIGGCLAGGLLIPR